MLPARPSVALADAMPFPAPVSPAVDPAIAPPLPEPPPTPKAAASPSPPPGPAEPPARVEPARRRSVASRLLRRPAERLRAYLTASLEHQFQLQAARTVDLAGAVARMEPQAEDALAHARETARRLESHAAHLTALLAEATSRLERLESLEAGLVQAAEAAGRSIRDQLELARQGRDLGQHAVRRLDSVLGVLGPRFDELEIKVRPLVDLGPDSVAVRTAEGYVVLPRADPLFVAAVANATSGGLEPGVRRVLRALLRPGDAAADVGANVGLLTTAMAFAVGSAGRVWAFEPETRVRAQLARTLQLNGLSQVALSGAAVGASPGRLRFHESPIIGHSSLYPLPEAEQADERAVEVEVTTLDAVVPAGAALTAVKIDVEGAELDVLAGMRRVLADSPDLAVVAEFGPSHLVRTGQTPADWFAAFAAHGLSPRRIAEPIGTVSPVTAEEGAREESVNLVWVRPGGAADGRLPR